MSNRLLSLAAGNLTEFSPVETALAAAAAGWPAAGIWFDAQSWTTQTTRVVRDTFERNRLTPLDIEVLWVRPGPINPEHERLLAAGGEIGAHNALMVSSDPDPEDTKRQFERYCEIADTYNLNLCLEFLPITEVKTLHQALDIVQSVNHPRGRILLDTLHLIRSGGRVADISQVPEALISYAQPCDGELVCPQIGEDPILRDAVDGRALPGHGELPLAEFVRALPAHLPLSPEIRSAHLRAKYPDAEPRAAAIYNATRDFIDRQQDA